MMLNAADHTLLKTLNASKAKAIAVKGDVATLDGEAVSIQSVQRLVNAAALSYAGADAPGVDTYRLNSTGRLLLSNSEIQNQLTIAIVDANL